MEKKVLVDSKILFAVENLKKLFPLTRRLIRAAFLEEKLFVPAVDGISFQLKREEVLGLCGESGSGKTTTGRLLSRLEIPTEGTILFKGVDVTNLSGHRLKDFRRKVQMIFQDPFASLDPRFTIYKIVHEPLVIHDIGSSKDERVEMVCDILKNTGLSPPERFLDKYPNQLSGGQRQRVAIARALILHPECVIADEPLSMLDISVRSGIMNLMLRAKKQFNIAYLFIAHDLSVLRYVSDRIATMYLGKIIEIGPVEEIIPSPSHPYTQLLISAVPIPDPTYARQRVSMSEPVPDIVPKGCRFHPRCSYAKDICTKIEPELKEIKNNHFVACHTR